MKTEASIERSMYAEDWPASSHMRDCLLCIWLTMPLNCGRRATGTGILNMRLSAAAAADQYIVSRGGQKTVIAGYHWFSDWGRDTMIALSGLTLPTGKFDVARSILRTFARHVDQGMLPNRLPDAGEMAEYNTVDATLWFFEAARAYLAYTGDLTFVHDELYPVFRD